MKGNSYPTTAQFRDLTSEEKATRLDVAEDLAALCQFWRGDPNLSAWDEGFLSSIHQRIAVSRGRYKISRKEWDQIRRIQALMEGAQDPPEEDPDPEDPTCC
jgi:hypothetical protein